MNARGTSESGAASRGALGFGFWGGGVAWLAHLLSIYAIAEFGCLSRLGGLTFLGATGVAWMVLAASTLSLLVTAAAAVLAFRQRRRLREEPHTQRRDAESFLASTGLVTSGLFAFIILVETVPVFFYLHDC